MNTNLRTKLTAALCLGCGIACFSAVARAADEALPSEVVRYADLNIVDPAGALTLYHRIQAAARRVCSSEVALDRQLWVKDQSCYRHAVDEAVKRVDSASLSQIHGYAMPRLASR
jgi:UrcA family protein